MKIYSTQQMWQELQSTKIGMEHVRKTLGEDDEAFGVYLDQYNVLCLVAGVTREEEELMHEKAIIAVAEDIGYDRLAQAEADNHYWKSHEEINNYCMRGF